MYFPLANSTVQGPDVGARPTGITGTVYINKVLGIFRKKAILILNFAVFSKSKFCFSSHRYIY